MFASREAAQAWQRTSAVRNRTLEAATGRMLDAARLGPGKRVLDVGAGTGDTSIMAATRVLPGGEVVAIDASAPMLEVAVDQARAAGLVNVSTRVMDAGALDLQPASFDAVIARHSLQFVAETGAALAGAHRVLRPGGRLAAIVFAEPEENRYLGLPVAVAKRMGLLRVPETLVMRPFHLAHADGLVAALSTAGFADVVVERIASERRLASPEAALEFFREGPVLRTIAEQLTAAELAWLTTELAREIEGFRVGAEVVGPTLMLVLSATT